MGVACEAKHTRTPKRSCRSNAKTPAMICRMPKSLSSIVVFLCAVCPVVCSDARGQGGVRPVKARGFINYTFDFLP